MFKFSIPITVRYADLDALGHVNHATFFTYMESARLGYAQEVLGWSGKMEELTMIIAQATCDYKLPLMLGDRVRVEVRIARLGNSSFDMVYRILSAEAVAAEGKTTLVVFDYTANTSAPIPAEWRERATDFEPELG